MHLSFCRVCVCVSGCRSLSLSLLCAGVWPANRCSHEHMDKERWLVRLSQCGCVCVSVCVPWWLTVRCCCALAGFPFVTVEEIERDGAQAKGERTFRLTQVTRLTN